MKIPETAMVSTINVLVPQAAIIVCLMGVELCSHYFK